MESSGGMEKMKIGKARKWNRNKGYEWEVMLKHRASCMQGKQPGKH